MRQMLVAAILTLYLISLAAAGVRGLHNSTKRFTKSEDMLFTDWRDQDEMERTWRSAIVRIPTKKGRSRRLNIAKLEATATNSKKKLPTVIYLHGCSGIWPGTYRRIKFLADNGFLVIAPASFARKKYPRSCNTKTYKGGLYRHILKMRQADAGYAIKQAKKLPIVDKENVFLMGLSEGGIATATFSSGHSIHEVRARVVEGWTCHAGWFEYKGIKAPEREPVLTLVGSKDPWFQDRWTKGDCTQFVNKTNGSKSIVYRKGTLARKHELLAYKGPRTEVLKFLRSHIK